MKISILALFLCLAPLLNLQAANEKALNPLPKDQFKLYYELLETQKKMIEDLRAEIEGLRSDIQGRSSAPLNFKFDPVLIGDRFQPSLEVGALFRQTFTLPGRSLQNHLGAYEDAGDGSISLVKLQPRFKLSEQWGLDLSFPYFLVNAAAAGADRDYFGNFSARIHHLMPLKTESDEFDFALSYSLDVFFPSARKHDSYYVAMANPSIDYFSFSPTTLTASPGIAAALTYKGFAARSKMAYSYSWIQLNPGGTTFDANKNQHRFTTTLQTAVSQKITSWLRLNLEYNLIVLATDAVFHIPLTHSGKKRFRHALVPSAQFEIDDLTFGFGSQIPTDDDTRDIQTASLDFQLTYRFE